MGGKKRKPFVMVIVPCRNEGRFINKCLHSLVHNDYPKDRLQIIVVDGMSSDDTWAIATYYQEIYPYVRLLSNPKKTTPHALNIGIKYALDEEKTDIVMRADAHSKYPFNYISKCVGYSDQAKNVGGRLAVMPQQQGLVKKAIVLARHTPMGPQKRTEFLPDLVMIAGAHCEYPRDYISKCAGYSDQAKNVGGRIKPVAKDKVLAKAIVKGRNDQFGCGGSNFRKGEEEILGTGGIVVDTVFGGCYQREVFDKIGLFNQKLTRGQDLEFNLRLKRAGMKTMLFPDIVSTYYPNTEFWYFIRHAFQDGKWITLAGKYAEKPITLRHLVPMIFVLTLPVSIMPYAILNMIRSIQLALRSREWKFALILPLIFFALHFFYGAGSIWGLMKRLYTK